MPGLKPLGESANPSRCDGFTYTVFRVRDSFPGRNEAFDKIQEIDPSRLPECFEILENLLALRGVQR